MDKKIKISSKIMVRKNLFVWCVALVLIAAFAVGDSDHEAAVVSPHEVNSNGAVMVTNVVADVNGGGTFQSISFQKDATVKTALRVLAARFEKNIVPTPNVDGVIGFTSLYNVTFEEAMDAILGTNMRYEQKGQLIKVYTRDEYKKMMEDKDRVITKVYKLYYISAAEAVRLVTPVLSEIGIVTGSSPAQKRIPIAEAISAVSGGGDDMALNDRVIIVDYPEAIERAEKLLMKIDRRPTQVLVEAAVLVTTLNEDTKFGIDWSLLDGVAITNFPSQNAGGGTPVEQTGFAFLAEGLRVGISAGGFQAFISALEEITDTTLLASPKVLAINKQLGQVYIGTKIGYQSQVTQTDGGTTTEKVDFLETGTKLSFRPYIGDDGFIRMDIHSKDSSGQFNAQDVPNETSAEIASNIMVKDGQTIVIGGLFRDVVTQTRQQLPVLGSLPIIGGAFRGTTDTTRRQEVIVLLTPHIIEDPSEIDGAEAKRDIEMARDGARENMQWISRRRLSEDHYVNAAEFYAEGDMCSALEELDKALELRPTYLKAMEMRERITNSPVPDF